MKIATFNVNGVKGRLPRLLEWLEEERPDVACLQWPAAARPWKCGAACRATTAMPPRAGHAPVWMELDG